MCQGLRHTSVLASFTLFFFFFLQTHSETHAQSWLQIPHTHMDAIHTHTNAHRSTHRLASQPIWKQQTPQWPEAQWVCGGGIQSLSLHRCTHTHIPSPGSVSCIAACLSWQMWPSDQTLTNSCLVIRGCWWGGERGGESQAGAGSGTCCGTERQRSVCTAQEEA